MEFIEKLVKRQSATREELILTQFKLKDLKAELEARRHSDLQILRNECVKRLSECNNIQQQLEVTKRLHFTLKELNEI